MCSNMISNMCSNIIISNMCSNMSILSRKARCSWGGLSYHTVFARGLRFGVRACLLGLTAFFFFSVQVTVLVFRPSPLGCVCTCTYVRYTHVRYTHVRNTHVRYTHVRYTHVRYTHVGSAVLLRVCVHVHTCMICALT